MLLHKMLRKMPHRIGAYVTSAPPTSPGRKHDATKLFEKLLGLANDVGLLSKEYDTGAGRLIGNFPQAFSHIALVHAAVRLAGCPR